LIPKVSEFIKKLEKILEITLPEDQPMNIAQALADSGLVGQLM